MQRDTRTDYASFELICVSIHKVGSANFNLILNFAIPNPLMSDFSIKNYLGFFLYLKEMSLEHNKGAWTSKTRFVYQQSTLNAAWRIELRHTRQCE